MSIDKRGATRNERKANKSAVIGQWLILIAFGAACGWLLAQGFIREMSA